MIRPLRHSDICTHNLALRATGGDKLDTLKTERRFSQLSDTYIYTRACLNIS